MTMTYAPTTDSWRDLQALAEASRNAEFTRRASQPETTLADLMTEFGLKKTQVQRLMKDLNIVSARKTEIIRLYTSGEETSLSELGRRFKVSGRRIREILEDAHVFRNSASVRAAERQRLHRWIVNRAHARALKDEDRRVRAQQILADLKALGTKLGHTPTLEDLRRTPGAPTPKQLGHYFGGVQRALRLAGF